MTIGFDANEANVEKRVGSGQYAFEILRHIVQIPKDKFTIYLKNTPRLDFPQPSEQITYRIFGPKPLWTQIALPFHLYTQSRPDVFFSPAHYAPRFSPVPTVITVHDLSYLKFPHYFLKKDIRQLENWTKYSVKHARKIITPSQSAKNDVIKYYNFPAENITVVHHGYDKERFFDDLDKAKVTQIKQTYGIKNDYILYVGTLQPRKNINNLLEAYKSIANSYPSLQLVIAGKKGWLFDDIFIKVKALQIEDRVLFTDYVKDDEVAYLYKGAKLYILPSLYEGFGMPLLEAMACGTPVAASNVSSMPEIIGPGLLFDPEDIKDIAQAIVKVLQMPIDLYEKLQQEGIAFATTFSWEKAANETVQVLHAAVKDRS